MSDPNESSVLSSQVLDKETVPCNKVKEIRHRVLLSTAMKLIKPAIASEHTCERAMEALKSTNGNPEK